MAPQPYTATGRMNLEYVVLGLLHKMRFPCELHDPTVFPQVLSTTNGAFPVVLASVAAQAAWDHVRPQLATGSAAASYLLEQNFSGTFVPLEGGVLTGVGTGGGTAFECGEVTFTFKDLANRKLKLIVLEGEAEPPTHNIVGAGSAGQIAFWSWMLTPGTGSAGKDWVASRTGLKIERGTFVTNALNKRVRRSRGLV